MKPIPPEGFIPFKWKTKKTADAIQNVCPVCGECGTCWDGGGFQDPAVQKADEEQEAQDIVFYERKTPDGSDLKSDESRWGSGHCITCNTEFWHTFECDHAHGCTCGQWHYYYRQKQQEVLSTWMK
jgi:hypothetical protein